MNSNHPNGRRYGVHPCAPATAGEPSTSRNSTVEARSAGVNREPDVVGAGERLLPTADPSSRPDRGVTSIVKPEGLNAAHKPSWHAAPVTVRIHRAERTARLADGLGDLLITPLEGPFAEEVVVVPARGVERC